MLHCAALLIGCREIEPPDAREGDRGGAERAGLQRYIEVGTGQSLTAKLTRRSADREHFGMGRWIMQFPRAVAGAGNQLSIQHDRRATGVSPRFAAPAASSKAVCMASITALPFIGGVNSCMASIGFRRADWARIGFA